jgi:flagellar motility protein MotE (MotC chaperone)
MSTSQARISSQSRNKAPRGWGPQVKEARRKLASARSTLDKTDREIIELEEALRRALNTRREAHAAIKEHEEFLGDFELSS